MKKMLFFICMLFIIAPMCVRADHIYGIDVNVFVEKDGSAHITEVWDVQASSGTEWCKRLSNMENTEISGFYVQLDGLTLLPGEWKVNGSLEDKANSYGINYTTGGMELCFGKTDMERHKFTFGYDVSDYIITTDDSQVLYHVLAPEVTVDTFFADVITYYGLPDTTEVWGYGYEGNSYVENGRLVFSKYEKLENQYVVALAKFPLGTFDNNKTIDKFDNFNDVQKDAEKGGYEYKLTSKSGWKFIFLDFVFILLSIFVVLLIVEFIVRRVTGKSLLKNEKVMAVLHKIGDVLKKVFNKVIPVCKKVFSKFMNLCKKLFPKLLEIFKKLGRKLKQLFWKLKDKFKKKDQE